MGGGGALVSTQAGPYLSMQTERGSLDKGRGPAAEGSWTLGDSLKQLQGPARSVTEVASRQLPSLEASSGRKGMQCDSCPCPLKF